MEYSRDICDISGRLTVFSFIKDESLVRTDITFFEIQFYTESIGR